MQIQLRDPDSGEIVNADPSRDVAFMGGRLCMALLEVVKQNKVPKYYIELVQSAVPGEDAAARIMASFSSLAMYTDRALGQIAYDPVDLFSRIGFSDQPSPVQLVCMALLGEAFMGASGFAARCAVMVGNTPRFIGDYVQSALADLASAESRLSHDFAATERLLKQVSADVDGEVDPEAEPMAAYVAALTLLQDAERLASFLVEVHGKLRKEIDSDTKALSDLDRENMRKRLSGIARRLAEAGVVVA